MRTLMPSNPHLGFSKAGFPMSFLSLGGADLATAARELKPADMVRALVPRGSDIHHRLTSDAADRSPTSWCARSSIVPLYFLKPQRAPVRGASRVRVWLRRCSR